MSIIVRHWECYNCHSKFERYVSFGHPDEDFDFKWKCEKCGRVNVYHVYSWFSEHKHVEPIRSKFYDQWTKELMENFLDDNEEEKCTNEYMYQPT